MLPLISGDEHDFRVVNDFARDTGWLHGFMTFMANDGVALLAVALVVAWWLGRRDDSPRRVAIAGWGALAALAAVALAQPISHAADEPRPFVAMPHALTLVRHATAPGFPSDPSTASGAVAAALLFVSWRLGLLTTLVSLLIAFSRVYVGVHFPQDVLAGLALGAAVAVLGVFVVVPFLTRGMEALARTRLRRLVVSGPAAEQAL